MMGARGFAQMAQSAPLFALVCLVAAPLILLRLTGVLFFASTTSMWAVVPAITLCALIAVAIRKPAKSGGIATALVAMYLCSVLLHGWADMTFRLGQGQSNFLDLLEAALVLILFARCLTAFPARRE
jgi:hypothetical protein